MSVAQWRSLVHRALRIRHSVMTSAALPFPV
jgi:hypothetical protein